MRRARWHAHVNAVQASPAMCGWLTDRMSLTQKLIAHSEHFRVKKLSQGPALCLGDEAAALGLARPLRVQEREVALMCDGLPVVFGHTVVPMTATAHDWPFFSSLGERSLGSTLFGDPRVLRGELMYARLDAVHPLAQRAAAATGEDAARWYARRCLFRRRNGILLVTEVFSPRVLGLQRRVPTELLGGLAA